MQVARGGGAFWARFLAPVWLVASACSFDPSGLAAGGRIDAGAAIDGGDDAPDGGLSDAAPVPPPTRLGVWITLPDRSRLLARAPDVVFGEPEPGLATIDIDPAVRYQSMVGFGASLTESSAYVVSTLPASQRTALLRRLFDRAAGIGLGVLRQPIGASDFALGNYTYDDTAPDLTGFTVQRDRTHVLPLLAQIRAINPGLVLMASPWSPPGWMKTSGSLIGGSLRVDRRAVFASYLVRFVEAYAAEGVPIAAVTLQNEPGFVPSGYPGMLMSAEDQAAVIAGELGPALAARGLDTQVFVWDHNWDEVDYPLEVLADPAVRSRIAGTAFHCYDGEPEAQSEVHDAHPDLAIWITECSDGDWRGDFADSLHYTVETLLIRGIRHWAEAVIKWNLVLDDRNGPTNGGCTDCRGAARIGRSDGAVELEADYYALGHLARFVAPGARRIESTSVDDGLQSVAFQNPDGGIVVLVLNASDDEQTFQIGLGGRAARTVLPAGAVATFAQPADGLALDPTGWRATASRSDGAQVAARAIDGDLDTRWTSGTPQDGEQWLAVDLGAPVAFSAITVDAGGSTGDHARRYDVRVSDDGVTWSEPVAAGTGDAELFTIRFPPRTARHVMVHERGARGATASWWSIHELTLHR
jgi:glucosylceramidase